MFRAGLVLLLLSGCIGSESGTSMVILECSDEGTCGGATDCYSACFCETDDTDGCEQECGPRGKRVQDLDESPWQAEWEDREAQVLELVNEIRAEGACCGTEGCFEPASSLDVEGDLRRSARAHAWDMGEQAYFSHDSQDGRSAFDRIRESSFRGCAMGENLAAGQMTPDEVMESWLESDEHCANIMAEDFDSIGVGYYFAPGHLEMHIWVQNFGG